MKKFFGIALARMQESGSVLRKCAENEGNILCSDYSESITLLNVAKESLPKNSFDLVENIKSNIKIKKPH